MSRTWRSHVTHMNESCHTHERVMSHRTIDFNENTRLDALRWYEKAYSIRRVLLGEHRPLSKVRVYVCMCVCVCVCMCVCRSMCIGICDFNICVCVLICTGICVCSNGRIPYVVSSLATVTHCPKCVCMCVCVYVHVCVKEHVISMYVYVYSYVLESVCVQTDVFHTVRPPWRPSPTL